MANIPIEYRITYLNSLGEFGFLHYPDTLYDLAVIHNGKGVIVKPIIEVLPGNGFFNFKGKSFFLRDFAHDDGSNIPPDWVIEWVNERINKKPFKIDLRMSDMDRFMLDGTIRRRQREAANILEKFGQSGSADIS